jgi:hypothetical protein
VKLILVIAILGVTCLPTLGCTIYKSSDRDTFDSTAASNASKAKTSSLSVSPQCAGLQSASPQNTYDAQLASAHQALIQRLHQTVDGARKLEPQSHTQSFDLSQIEFVTELLCEADSETASLQSHDTSMFNRKVAVHREISKDFAFTCSIDRELTPDEATSLERFADLLASELDSRNEEL